MTYARVEYQTETDYGTGFPLKTEGTTYSVFFPNCFSLGDSKSVTIPTAEQVRQEETVLIPNLSGGYFKLIEVISKDSDTNLGETTVLTKVGTYSATYRGTLSNGDNVVPTTFINLIYIFSIVENHLPLKKWTITDVINRIFDTVVPLFWSKKPKFRLKGVIYGKDGTPSGVEQGSTADKLNKILAPEMTFTKMTLREMLKQVGGFIHGEPKITSINTSGGRWYEVDFDFYGGYEYSNISKRKYVSATLRTDINEFCTSLDSSADNLINRLDWASGVIVEPYLSGAKSLRTETVTVRMAEDNSTFISTDFPIDTVYKLEEISKDNVSTDITPYLFENADYKNLSSYDGVYPFSKAFGLYYSYGQKNIRGLFFKVPNAKSSYLEKYAIVNILDSAGSLTKVSGQNYMKLSFRVTYLPVYSARIITNKQTIINGSSRTLAYNQGANQIETRYYGENLKGVIARLGNVEKTYTYNVAFLSDIPKVGTLFDDNYYISAVATEILPSYIKVTVSLSKDFNRLSQYVGISSEKRMWEVSERQAFNRDTVINDKLVVSKNQKFNFIEETSIFDTYLQGNVAKVLFNTFNKGNNFVSLAKFKKYSKTSIYEDLVSNKFYTDNNTIALPVLSVAIGNSMLFSVRFEDNYNAGQKSIFVKGKKEDYDKDDVTGYWGAYVPYNDYYGRFYYCRLQMYYGDREKTVPDYNKPEENLEETRLNFPAVNVGASSNTLFNDLAYIKYRKDSREIPTITVEMTAVTDNSKIIIGSALMKNCSLVNQRPKTYELYVFNRRLSTIDSVVDFDGAIKINESFTVGTFYIDLPSVALSHSSWAIVTTKTTRTINVEDDNGKPTTQDIFEGGELVLGGNESLSNGLRLFFHVGGEVYD